MEPGERAAIAFWMAVVSLAEPLPAAPKFWTLRMLEPPPVEVVEPEPEREMEAGELEALLATETLPEKLPAEAGAKETDRVTD